MRVGVFPSSELYSIVLFFTRARSGKAAITLSFSFMIKPTDLEAPLVSYCPSNIYSLIPNKEASTVVNWTAPTFTDNVRVVNVEVFPPYSPGDTFQPGSVSMTYTAKDAENNKKECKFSIIVRRKWISVISITVIIIRTTLCLLIYLLLLLYLILNYIFFFIVHLELLLPRLLHLKNFCRQLIA